MEIAATESERMQRIQKVQISIYESIEMAANAWGQVSTSVLVNCWRKADLFPSPLTPPLSVPEDSLQDLSSRDIRMLESVLSQLATHLERPLIAAPEFQDLESEFMTSNDEEATRIDMDFLQSVGLLPPEEPLDPTHNILKLLDSLPEVLTPRKKRRLIDIRNRLSETAM